MKFTLKELRDIVKETLDEAQGALKMLDVIHMRLVLAKEKKVEEILTGIRIIKGVATVSQAQPIQRLPNGVRTMEVLVTFDSGDIDVMTYIDAMARLTKKIDAVTTVIIKSLNDRPIRDSTGNRKLVY